MQRTRRITHLLLSVAVALLLGGCWDNVDPRNRAFVTAIGLDLGTEEELEVTFQIPSPGTLRGLTAGGGRTQEIPASIAITGRGRTFAEAMADAQSDLSRELYLGQTNLIVFGQDLVEQGLRPIVYELVRTPEFVTCYFAMAKQARETLTVVPKLEPLPGIHIRSFYESVRMMGRHVRVPLWKVYRDLRTPGVNPILPILEVKAEILRLSGLVLLVDDRMGAILNMQEARGLTWLMGTVKGESITVEVDGSLYTVNRVESTTMMKVEAGRSKPAAWARIRLVGELHASTPVVDRTKLNQIEAQVKKIVTKEVRQVMDKVKATGSDPVRFGARVYNKSPWMPESAEKLPALPVPDLTLEVEVRIAGTGMRR